MVKGFFVKKQDGVIYKERQDLLYNDGYLFLYNEEKEKTQLYSNAEYAVCFSGEIYSGISNNLLETILDLYTERGMEFLNSIDGVFSLLIYDRGRKKVILARDQLGSSQIFYQNEEEVFSFSTKLNSDVFNKSKINKAALSQYLQLTYIPAPYTIYNNISKLEAGKYVEVSLDNITFNEYWDIEISKNPIQSYNKGKELLREYLFQSVENRSKSGEVGALLSGGIDSTIVTGVLARQSSKPIKTFTIGFKNKDYDESERSQIAADYHSTDHHIFFLDYDEVLVQLDDILNSFDEPFADSSSIPFYMVSKFASKHVDVVLTGDAGDELFAGYSKYLIGKYSALYNKVPKYIRELTLKKIIYSLPDKTPLTRKARKVIDNAEFDVFTQRKNLMKLGFKEEEVKLLLKVPVNEDLQLIDNYYNKFNYISDELTQALYTDFKVVLEGDMLVKANRMSQANNLITRAPLQSKKIIELAYNIPSNHKINFGNQKIILKDTFEDLIPKKLLNASKKGFGVPIDHWLRGPLKKYLIELLDKNFIEDQNLFNFDFIQHILNQHLSGKRNRKSELWALLVFQHWYKNTFVKK